MRQLFAWLRERKIDPLISQRFALAQAPQALEALLGRTAIGKVVIVPGDRSGH